MSLSARPYTFIFHKAASFFLRADFCAHNGFLHYRADVEHTKLRVHCTDFNFNTFFLLCKAINVNFLYFSKNFYRFFKQCVISTSPSVSLTLPSATWWLCPPGPPPAFEKAGTKLYVFISRFYYCVFNYLISYEMTIIKKNSCPLSFENEQLFSEHSACKKYSRTNDSKSGYYQESPCK